jgi:hypothetical protein
VVPCPQPYGYRNRIMIRSQWDKFKQGLNIGFIRADNRLVVDLEECKIAEPALNEQILHVRAHPPPKGGLKVVLRIPPEGWEVPPDSFFQNNFFLLPGSWSKSFASGCAKAARIPGGCLLRRRFLQHRIGRPGRVLRRGGIWTGMAIKAARRNAAARGRANGEFVAGPAEELLPALAGAIHRRSDDGAAGPAAQGLPAETLQRAAPGATRANHLRLLPPGDDGAGLERFVRRRCL